MTITVRGRANIRFERRWQDYCRLIEEGTSPLVGRSEPKPGDMRDHVKAAASSGVAAADEVLDKIWVSDAGSWPQRLRTPFLDGFSRRANDAFANLVKKGCQPDMLALQFFKATQAEEYVEDHSRIRADLEEIEKLSENAVNAVRTLANRRKQFDQYLSERELRVVEGEPGDAELQILKVDLEDLVTQHRADDLHLRQQVDGRRQPLLGHAEVRLSREVQEATGNYHDRDVEDVLFELRERLGLRDRDHGALKRRRARWLQQQRASGPRNQNNDE